MTDSDDLERGNPEHGDTHGEVRGDDECLLLSRVVDREDDLADWQALDGLAAEDGAVYARLAHLLRDDSGLRGALDFELASVEHVVAPVLSRRPWWTGLVASSGWAAALLVAALWVSGVGNPVGDSERQAPTTAPSVTGADGTAPVSTSASAWVATHADGQPLNASPPNQSVTGSPALDVAPLQPAFGRLVPSAAGVEVLGELSPELVSTRPAADGGIEVITVRRVLEREIVHAVYTVGSDELGRPVPIPVNSASVLASDVY